MSEAMTEQPTTKIGTSAKSRQIGKMVRQAESLPEGSPEREAFMEKAMALSAAYSIDMAVARAEAMKKEKVEHPEDRAYEVGERGKAKNSAHFVDLMLAIANSYDMKCVISHSNVYVYAHGMPSDHEMVERLFTLLAPQMVAEADKALKAGANKVKKMLPKTRREEIPEAERAWGKEVNPDDWNDEKRYAGDEYEVGTEDEYFSGSGYGRWIRYTLQAPPTHRIVEVTHPDGSPVMEEKSVSTTDARVWRANFYMAFVHATRARLRKARKQALKDAGIDMADEESAGGLVLRDKRKEIEDSFNEHNKTVLATGKTYGGAEVSGHDYTAQTKGREAGERAVHGDERDLRKGS